MKPERSSIHIAAIAFLAAVVSVPSVAQSGPAEGPRVAVLRFENASGDSRLDYLASLTEGILRYDLSVLAGIPIVERRSLDRILGEQELAMSGAIDPATAIRAGTLAGASYLVLGEYALAAGELALTVHLVDAGTGSAVTYRDRGVSEHVVHRVAEKLAARLLDRKGFVFADASNDRSLLSLRDETPGVILLYSPIRAAEIYLDEEFVGYTRGEPLEPIVLESVSPGKRQIRVHLSGGDFGVVLLPQVEFKDWETTIDVRPGGRHAVRDLTRHFNDELYRLEYLDSFRKKAAKAAAGGLAFSRDYSFADRSGASVAVRASVAPSERSSGVVLAISLDSGGTRAVGAAACPERPDAPSKVRVEAGLVALEVELGESGGEYWMDVRLRRTDVYQGMHRER